MEHLQVHFTALRPIPCPSDTLYAMLGENEKGYDFATGESLFPVPAFAQEELRNHACEGSYVSTKGISELREKITSFHLRMDGFKHFDPDGVIVGPGSAELIFLLMHVIRGDVYLVSPAWDAYKPQALLAGRNVHIIETSAENGWKLTPDLLRPYSTVADYGSLLIFVNPHNPTGTCYTRDEIRALAETLRISKMFVLSDEIFARLSYDGTNNSISEFIPEKTIVSSGISKWAGCGGWRLGYQMYPKELYPVLAAVETFAGVSYVCCPGPVQKAAMSLMTHENEVAEYLQHVVRILAAVSRYCTRVLTKHGVKVTPTRAAFFMFPDFEAYRQRLKKRGITTGQGMCSAMGREVKIAIQSGGPWQLKNESSLTARLCFNHFDGAAALTASRALGERSHLGDEFVKEHCKETVEGLNELVRWLLDL